MKKMIGKGLSVVVSLGMLFTMTFTLGPAISGEESQATRERTETVTEQTVGTGSNTEDHQEGEPVVQTVEQTVETTADNSKALNSEKKDSSESKEVAKEEKAQPSEEIQTDAKSDDKSKDESKNEQVKPEEKKREENKEENKDEKKPEVKLVDFHRDFQFDAQKVVVEGKLPENVKLDVTKVVPSKEVFDQISKTNKDVKSENVFMYALNIHSDKETFELNAPVKVQISKAMNEKASDVVVYTVQDSNVVLLNNVKVNKEDNTVSFETGKSLNVAVVSIVKEEKKEETPAPTATPDSKENDKNAKPEEKKDNEVKKEEQSKEKKEEKAVDKIESLTFTQTVSGKAIKIEGKFPQGTDVKITPVKFNELKKEVQNELKKQSANNQLDEKDFLAFDFDFFKGDKHDIQPEGQAKITINNVTDAKDQDADLKAFHIDDKNADKVNEVSVNKVGNDVQLTADSFSIYAIISEPASETDGKIWIGRDDKTTYRTIKSAIDAALTKHESVVHISGNFNQDNNGFKGVEVPSGITLNVFKDTTITGNGENDGITLKSGSKLSTNFGTTLNMNSFKRAIVVEKDAEINEGHYTLHNNFKGVEIHGSVIGIKNHERLIITSNDKDSTDFIMPGAKIVNAKLIIDSKQPARIDADANYDGAEIYLNGFNNGWYVNGGSILNSQLVSFFYKSGDKKTLGAMVIDGTTTIDNSLIDISGAYIPSFMVKDAGEKLTISNSTLKLGQSTMEAAMQIQKGNVHISNSIVQYQASGQSGGPLFRFENETGGTVTVDNGSVLILEGYLVGVNSKNVSTQMDSSNVRVNRNLILDGALTIGSYNDMFSPEGRLLDKKFSLYNVTANAYPVNSKGDTLYLFELETRGNSFVVNNGNVSDTYPLTNEYKGVKNGVWAPSITVTLDLNKESIPDAKPYFGSEDHTENLELYTIPGNTLGYVTKRNDAAISKPMIPTALGYEFTGWFDESGNQVDISKVFYKDTKLLAHWKKVENFIPVKYHSNGEKDYVYQSQSNVNNGQIQLKNMTDIVKADNRFDTKMKFVGWSLEKDGKVIESNYNIGDKKEIEVYAIYDKSVVEVSFNANGGAFTDALLSKFKEKTDLVSVSENKDEIKFKAYYGANLQSIIKNAMNENENPASLMGNDGFDVSDMWDKVSRQGYRIKDVHKSSYPKMPDERRAFWYSQPFGSLIDLAPLDQNTTVLKEQTYYIDWVNNDYFDWRQFNALGDLVIETKTKTPFNVRDKSSISVTSRLNLAGMEEQFSQDAAGLEEEAKENDQPVLLDNVDSALSFIIKLPNMMTIPADFETNWDKYIELSGYDDAFNIRMVETGIKDKDQFIRVILKYPLENNNSSTSKKVNYELFKDNMLRKDTDDTNDTSWLSLKIDNLGIDSSSLRGSLNEYKITAEYEGFIEVTADVGRKVSHKYEILAPKQWESGKDDYEKNNDVVSATLLYKSDKIDNSNKIQTDILVNNDTQHKQTHPVKLNDALKHSVRYDLTGIKDILNSQMANEMSQRKVFDLSATFDIDKDLDLQDDLYIDLKKPDSLTEDKPKFIEPTLLHKPLPASMYYIRKVRIQYISQNDANQKDNSKKVKRFVDFDFENKNSVKIDIRPYKNSENFKVTVWASLQLDKFYEMLQDPTNNENALAPRGSNHGAYSDDYYLEINIGQFVVAKHGTKNTQTIHVESKAQIRDYYDNPNEANSDPVVEFVSEQSPSGADSTGKGGISFTSEIVDDHPVYVPFTYHYTAPKVYKPFVIELKWEGVDASLQSPVKVQLYQNGIPTDRYVTLSTENDWKAVLDDLDLMDEFGEIIQYTVKEVNEVNGDVRIGNHYYKVKYEYDKDGKGVVITNTRVQRIPYTGDDNNVTTWIAVSLMALALAIGCALALRKSERE